MVYSGSIDSFDNPSAISSGKYGPKDSIANYYGPKDSMANYYGPKDSMAS